MKKTGRWNKGRFFYILLGMLVVFVNVPLLVVLTLTQGALTASHERLESILNSTTAIQMKYVQESRLSRNHTAQLTGLRSHELLARLGEAESLEYGPEIAEAERILAETTPSASDYGSITVYLYFPKSGYLIDSAQPGGNRADSADARIFDGFAGMDPTDTDFARTFMHGGTSGNETTSSIYTAVIFPNVIFIFDIIFSDDYMSVRPDVSLSKEFTASLKDVETCDYDSYGNARAKTGSAALAYQFDYYTLGSDCDRSFAFRQNGHYYYCYYVYNEGTQTKYALFFRDETGEIMRTASVTLWVSGGLLMAVCLVCAVLCMRRAYAPMDSLISRLGRNGDDRAFRDDFRVLNEAIDSFDDRLNKRDGLLARFYLLRLLRGQRVDSLEEFHDDWLVLGGGCSYAVAAVHVDETVDGERFDESRLEPAVQALLKADGRDIRTVTDGEFLFVLFRLTAGTAESELYDAMRRLQEKLPDCCVSIYISALHASGREIHRCYSEVMRMSEYYLSREIIGCVADYASLPETALTQNTSSPDYGQLHKLSDCISSLSTADALNVYDGIVYRFERAWGHSPGPDDGMFVMLVNTIAMAFYDIDTMGDLGKTVLQQYVNDIRGSGGPDELRELTRKYLGMLAGRSEGQDLQRARFEEIREYVLENYSCQSLDSMSTAEHFGTSPSTITRLFKKYNNTGFLEYVHHLRVLKAKELLKNTDLPVSEISALVGYTNVVTMNRAFKTYIKTTPGMIRKMSR